MNNKPILGVIGGSGLYDIPGLQNIVSHSVQTPFGEPSTPVVMGELEGQPVAFLARHGEGHHLSPSEVNYRANIYALKMLGVERIIGVSACGSLREDFEPGHIVIPDQLFDMTKERKRTFFEDGLVGHVGVADPFCNDLSNQLYQAVKATGTTVHKKGTYITIEGPRFSTRGESNTYRAWGMSIIGMTTSPEAYLAREAEICYSVIAHVTDYDVWRIGEAPVSVKMVTGPLENNTAIVKQTLANLIANINHSRENCQCSDALADALITNPAYIPASTRERLSLLAKKYMG